MSMEAVSEISRLSDLASKIMDMRVKGWSYSAIAKELGLVSGDAAYALVRETPNLDSVPETVEEQRALDVRRLDYLIQGLWNRSRAGDLQCIDRTIKLLDRRAKMLGLDMPTKTAITSADGKEDLISILTDDERSRRIQVLLGLSSE